MITNDYLLSFELTKEGDELDIHCDDSGLEKLLAILSQLKEKSQHEHLMTPKWGGNELTEVNQAEDSTLLNKVTIHKW